MAGSKVRDEFIIADSAILLYFAELLLTVVRQPKVSYREAIAMEQS